MPAGIAHQITGRWRDGTRCAVSACEFFTHTTTVYLRVGAAGA